MKKAEIEKKINFLLDNVYSRCFLCGRLYKYKDMVIDEDECYDICVCCDYEMKKEREKREKKDEQHKN